MKLLDFLKIINNKMKGEEVYIDINDPNGKLYFKDIANYDDGYNDNIDNDNSNILKSKRKYKFYKTKLFKIGIPCVLVCGTLIGTLKMCNSDNESVDEVIPISSVSMINYNTIEKTTINSKTIPSSSQSIETSITTSLITTESNIYNENNQINTIPSTTAISKSVIEKPTISEEKTTEILEPIENSSTNDNSSNEYYIDPEGNSWVNKDEYEEWKKALEEESKTYVKNR